MTIGSGYKPSAISGSRIASRRLPAACYLLFAFHIREERVNKFSGVKQGKIFGLLANPHIFDREFELLANGDNDPAFGGPIQFGEHDTRAAGRLREEPIPR